MKKVSVIIPVYNAAKYLEECLNSVCGQTLQDIEIICVDDGSTDASVSMLEKRCKEDSRITVLQSAHKGGGAARNVGMQQACGEYLAFLDADDYMDVTMLEKLYHRANENHADVVVCGVRFFYPATGSITDETCGLREENLPETAVFSYQDMPKRIFNTFHNWPWNKMFRREFIMNQGITFQEQLRTNDLLFTNKALILAEKITAEPERLVYYRRQEGQGDNCQSTNQVQTYGFYDAFIALQDFLKEKGIYEDVRQSYVNHALDGCIANLNTAEFSEVHHEIYDRLNADIFERLDILGHSDDYFYEFNFDSGSMERFHYVLENDYEIYLRFRGETLQNLYSNLQHDIYFADCNIANLKEEKNQLEREKEEIYASFSYRVGHAVTIIPRLLKRIVKEN